MRLERAESEPHSPSYLPYDSLEPCALLENKYWMRRYHYARPIVIDGVNTISRIVYHMT